MDTGKFTKILKRDLSKVLSGQKGNTNRGESSSEINSNVDNSVEAAERETAQKEKELTIELEKAKEQLADFDSDHIWAFIAGQYSQDFRGNPKYLFVYINQYRHDIAAYWLCSDEETIAQVRALGFTAYKLETPAAQYAINHTGVLVTEQVKASIPEGFSDIKYLNLWHGVGGFKNVERKMQEGDISMELARKYVDHGTFFRDHQLLGVTSPTIENLMSSDLGLDEDKVVRTGYFRCLYQKNFSPVCSYDHDLRKQKGLPQSTKLIVYAPTYRPKLGGTFSRAIQDFEALYQCCERNDLLLIFKVHPKMEEEEGFLYAKEMYGDKPRFWFWDNRDDFYEIIDQMDLAIIDYSSMFADFVAAGVPHYIRYIFDYDEYMESGFSEWNYFDYTIGEICRSFGELLSAVDTYQGRDDSKDFQQINEKLWAYAGGKDDFDKVIGEVMEYQIEERDFPTLYSFDIFDTLISRKVLEPKGIFYAVRDRMTEQGGFPKILEQHYPEIRHEAELNVREFYRKTTDLRDSERVEISFPEIFKRIADVYDLTEEQTDLLEQWELEEELDNVIPLTDQIDHLKRLLDRHETVILISDMYLPKDFIQKLLYKADPVLAELPIFLSNEYGVLKTTQKLYFEVYKSFKPFYDFKKWIHYGDSPSVDVNPARKFNICAREIPKPVFNDIQKEMVDYLKTGDAYLVAAMQARMCFRYFGEKDEFTISYIALTLVPYVDWAIRDALKRGYRTLYFISRDGYHLKRIADEIIRVRGLDLQTRYIYASRRTWRIPAFIHEVDKGFWLDYGNFADLTSKEKLFKAMDLDEDTFREFFPTIDPDEIDFNDKQSFDNIIEMFKDSRQYNDYLLDTAAKERVLVEGYLKQEINFDEPFAIVEYYGRGYTQDSMVQLCQDITGEKTQIPFYYMRTVLPTIGDAIRYNFTTNAARPFFMESIFANIPYKSIERYEQKEDGTIVPVIEPLQCDMELFESMNKILPEFAANYASLGLRNPADTDHFLHEFAFDYYDDNKENPDFAEKIGTLWDSVPLYGTKREFAPPFTKENLKQFADKELRRKDSTLTSSITMSVTRSSEEVKKEYFDMYQILPGDNVAGGTVLSEKNLKRSREFRQKYYDLEEEAEKFRAEYDQAVNTTPVCDKAIIVASGKSLSESGLDRLETALKKQERLETVTLSEKDIKKSSDTIIKELAEAKYIVVSQPIAQFCKTEFRPETKEIMLNSEAFSIYYQGLSCTYFLKWRTKYEQLGGKNDLSVLQVPSEAVEERYRKYYARGSKTDCSLRGNCNTDVYFDRDVSESSRQKLKEIFPESAGKKVILYMPKVRRRKDCQEWLSIFDMNILKDLIGEEYVVVVNMNESQLKGKYYNDIEIPGFSKMINSGFPLRHLMTACDVFVGDYRDTFYETALLGKPVYFTTADYEEIIKNKNVNTDRAFEDYVFGPVVSTANDLAEQLKHVDTYNYTAMEQFRAEFLTDCDGSSTDRVVRYMLDNLN